MGDNLYLNKFLDFCWNFGPKLLAAIAVFFIGLWIIKKLTRAFDHFLRVRKVDASLRPFFTSLTDTGMKIILVMTVANTVGLETTSFIAVFSAIAFSIGLALQGSLGNFASGVLILLFRPYKVGDLVTVGSRTGRVREIRIFNTILASSTGSVFIIPNGKMTEDAIENIPEGQLAMAHISLLIEPKTSLDWLQATVMSVAEKCPVAVTPHKTEVKIAGITRDDMKVEIALPVDGENYEQAIDYLYAHIKPAFEAAGIALAKERRRETI